MRLESLGLIVKYVNKPLAAGLAPETFKDYLNQRMRWCAGTLQIFLFNRKNIFKKLNFHQKCFYLSGILYYLLGFRELSFYCHLCFIYYLILGRYLPLYIKLHHLFFLLTVKISLFIRVAKKYRNILFTDIYETAIAFYLSLVVIKTFINPHNIKFSITSKDVGTLHTNYKLFLPQLIFLIIAIVSFIIPVYDLYKHIHKLEALILNLLLNLYNTVLLIFAVNVALEKKEKRKERRVSVKLQANLENHKENKMNVDVVNLSKQGALLFSRRDRSDELAAILKDENSLVLQIMKK